MSTWGVEQDGGNDCIKWGRFGEERERELALFSPGFSVSPPSWSSATDFWRYFADLLGRLVSPH